MSHAGKTKLSRLSLACMALLAILTIVASGCNKQASQTSQTSQEKRYHLVGKIVSIDQDQSMLVVDSEAIPGFMAAMTMPYPVRYKASLAGLGVGDQITADVLVANDGAFLDNIVVTKKGAGAATQPSSNNVPHQPQPGEKVPDFVLVNQDGKQIHLSSYKGHVLVVTFIYTRCPFPDYCPLVSQNFAKVYADTRSNPDLNSKMHLLTISFDTAYDTPKVLRDYAKTFNKETNGSPFARWEFAVVPPKDLKKVTDFFGLYYEEQSGQITHSMSTSVITPQGAIYKWYDDNDWKPSDLIAEATKALQEYQIQSEFNFRVRG